jgi:hypothetical protein
MTWDFQKLLSISTGEGAIADRIEGFGNQGVYGFCLFEDSVCLYVFCAQNFFRPLISCVVLGRALHAIIRLGIYSGSIWTLDEGSNSMKRPADARKHRIVCREEWFF